MHKKSHYAPRLVKVADKRGDDITPPRLAQELIDSDRAAIRAATVLDDFQGHRRRPLDAPMATRELDGASRTNYQLDDVAPSLGIGWALLALLLMAVSFIAGIAVGKL